MAYTQAQLDALQAAVAKGVKTVSYDGQSVTYQSISDMLALIDMIEKELGLKPATKRVVYSTGRGFR